jgi:hypothetical protein
MGIFRVSRAVIFSLVSLSANIILFSDEASIATLYFTTDFSGIVQGFFDNIFDMCMSVHI